MKRPSSLFILVLITAAALGMACGHWALRPVDRAYAEALSELVEPPPETLTSPPPVNPPFFVPPPTLPPFVVPATPRPYTPPRILVAGDVLLDNSVLTRIRNHGLDSVFPPEHRAPFLAADLNFINLEMPISRRGTAVPNKQWTFRGDPAHISLLTDMNVHIVSLANNHTLDYGRDAFLDTLDILTENGIRYVGGGRDIAEAKKWETYALNGKTVAFLAASRVMPNTGWNAGQHTPGHLGAYDPTALKAQIALAKREADYVFVYLHWGVERKDIPERWQRDMAYGYVDAGADVVIGAHPHVLQGFEYYKGKLIAYSLGNFIFTDKQKDTAALEFSIQEDGALTAKLYPYEIVNRATYALSDPQRLEKLRRHLNDISFGVALDENLAIRKTSE